MLPVGVLLQLHGREYNRKASENGITATYIAQNDVVAVRNFTRLDQHTTGVLTRLGGTGVLPV
jgi:hypothetical protein